MNLLSHLLPDRTCIRLETWHFDPVRSAITLTLQARRITARCPLCGRRSKRIHSRYERTLADLPWGAYAVTIRLRVRRLFCRNTRCERRIFAERLPGIALPWARGTQRLDARLTALAWRSERRKAQHEQVWALYRQGWSGDRIGLRLGISRRTVSRHLRSEVFPERRTRSDAGRSRIDPWQSVVIEHWNEGRVTGCTLLRELQRLGYRGSYATLMYYLRRLNALQGSVEPDGSRPVLTAVVPRRELTPRTAAWTVLRREERRSAQDREVLAELRRYNPELDEAIALAEEFAALVRGRQPERLDPWLQRAQDGTVVSLRRFAKRLSADYEAVRAAVTLGWSNGPVEGQINRLKMLKRTMYGRAGLDLLGRPFLLTV